MARVAAFSNAFSGEHTREQPRLNLPTGDYESAWEDVETIDLWVADRKSVKLKVPSALTIFNS